MMRQAVICVMEQNEAVQGEQEWCEGGILFEANGQRGEEPIREREVEVEGSWDGSMLGMSEEQQGGQHYLDRVGMVE